MMRWEYPDPSDLAEARRRELVIAAMTRWWEAFAENADAIGQHFDERADFDIPRFTNSFLNDVAEGLCWEYGPALRKDGHRLVITPEGELEQRPMVRELLRRAPQLERWEFYPGRLPEKPETAFPIADQIARFKPSGDVLVKASLGEFRRVDLSFHVPGSNTDPEAAERWIYRATEQLLGEDILNGWLGGVDLAPPQPLTKRLFGGKPAGFITAAQLRPTVDALIAASRDQLPAEPPRIAAQRDPESVPWSSFKREPPERDDYPWRSDLFVGVTPEPELFEAQANDTLFYSGRFSRRGETFAYLKIDRRGDERGGRPIESADQRGKLEEATNATLGEHTVGCTTGGGTGRLYGYIDLALTDVPRAIPALRELLQRHRVSERSWLLFFDAELADEWIGVYDHTPPPPAPPPYDDAPP